MCVYACVCCNFVCVQLLSVSYLCGYYTAKLDSIDSDDRQLLSQIRCDNCNCGMFYHKCILLCLVTLNYI